MVKSTLEYDEYDGRVTYMETNPYQTTLAFLVQGLLTSEGLTLFPDIQTNSILLKQPGKMDGSVFLLQLLVSNYP